ncbi:thiol-disulfide isomerase/thioredoxin/DNA-binding protein Fis [Pedobacter sp. UYP24]
MNRIMKLNLFYIVGVLLLLSCKQPVSTTIEKPTIVSGTAKLTGTITVPDGVNRDSVIVKIAVTHQITGEFVKYEAVVDPSGRFSIDADVETAITFIRFATSLNPEKALLVKLKSGAVTNLDVTYNSNSDIESIDVTPAMDQNDMTQCYDLIRKMIEYPVLNRVGPLYDRSTDVFLNDSKSRLAEILTVLKDDKSISKELKGILYKDFGLLYYKGAVFDYDKAMVVNYRLSDGDKDKKPVIQKIDRSYYRFLKDLKLNDPQYLYAFGSFWEFQRKLLQNEILQIPKIDDTDIPTWLVSTKAILSDLVGFNDGLYYDILAANAYGRQLTEELRPLSEKQKANILNYWGKGDIAKILLRKNQQVAEFDKSKSPVVFNEVSKIAPEKIVEGIVARHPGKVILIDLWATWCGPCLEAMKRFRSTKNEFHDKDVVFVYLSNRSSPRKLWEEKIKGIGNEHYYLDDAQWTYIMTQFDFDAIPSYLLYNKKGVLVNKFTAFPQNDDVKAMINNLLK